MHAGVRRLDLPEESREDNKRILPKLKIRTRRWKYGEFRIDA